MKPGDKVRFLRSSGEGIIRKVNKDKTIDVEIEDGFVVPVLGSEVVVIASEEDEVFQRPESEFKPSEPARKAPAPKSKGLYLTVYPFNEYLYTLEIVNTSDFEILFTVAESERDFATGLAKDILPSGKSIKFGERKIKEFESWSPLLIHVLYFKYESMPVVAPLVKKVAFNPATFFRSKKEHPITGKEAYVFELENAAKVVFPEKFSESFTEDKTIQELRNLTVPSSEVDLHIEKLTDNMEGMTPGEILNFQIEEFNKSLESAIASGLEEITFIHGVGSGSLKNKIHKSLSKNKDVEFFQDARKEKFGYGATLVKIKK